MKEVNYNWELSEPQFDFFTHSSKFQAFLSARGAGKTSVGWMKCLQCATESPGSRGVIVAPSFPLIDDVILPEMDDWVPKEFILKDNRFKHNLFLDNGSVIMFRSADNARHIQRLRGLSISWFWIDEATLTPLILWKVLIGGLRQKGFKRQAWVTGTPKPASWVKNLFLDKLTKIKNSYALTDVPIESNRNLPADYIASLRDQYSGRFAAQELDGKFVEFEGLVYPDFSHRHLLSYDSNLLKPPFSRMIYAIDWGFRNPCCMLAINFKDNHPVVIQEFYRSHIIDDKLIELALSWRNQFGPGPIYCDPSQPDSIAKFRIAGLDAKAAKNPVVPGIKTVTSFLISQDKHLYVSPFCQNLINEFHSYCYSENSDMPIKINDHCFTAGTYISTSTGDVPIEHLKIGDFVLTRSGFYPIKSLHRHYAKTRQVFLSDGTILEGTPNHLIFIQGKFLPLDTLRYGLYVESLFNNTWQYQKNKNSTELFSGDTPILDGAAFDYIIAPILKKAIYIYIEKFGKRFMGEKFQKLLTSIISMVIRSIMILIIWNALLVKHTLETIQYSISKNIKKRHAGIWKKLDLSQKSGIDQKKEENGIVVMARKRGKIASRWLRYVTSVVLNSKRWAEEIQIGSVQTSVNPHGDAHRELMMKNVSALSVIVFSLLINILNLDSVQNRVHVVSLGPLNEKKEVYDLSISGPSEYYANGILVHNCLDSLRYALHSFQPIAPFFHSVLRKP